MSLQEDLAIYKNYSELAYAVIIQAAEDYFEYSRAVMRGQSKYGQSKEIMQKHLQKVIDFFNNKDGYYKFYCTIVSSTSDDNKIISEDGQLVLTGDKIMSMLNEMIEDEEKYPDDYIHLAI